MTESRIISAEQASDEVAIDRAIRPQTLKDYRGQPAVTEQLDIFIPAARSAERSAGSPAVFWSAGSG